MNPVSIVVLSLCSLVSAAAQTPATASPAGAAGGPLHGANWYPFGGAQFTYQQVHSAESFSTAGPLEIHSLSFRPQNASTPTTLDLEVFMAACPHGAEDASSLFEDNVIGGTEVNVFARRMVTLPTVATGDWSLTLPFDQPFSWDGGHLSWRVVIHGNTNGNQPTYYSVDAFSARGNSDRTGSVLGCSSALGTAPAEHYVRLRGPGSTGQFMADSYVADVGLPALLTIGTSAASADGLALPFDLGVIGAPGCWITNNIVWTATGTTQPGPYGHVSVPVTIPADPLLTGVRLFTQFAFLQPGANALGVFTTNGQTTEIGTNRFVTRIFDGAPDATVGVVDLHAGLSIGLN